MLLKDKVAVVTGGSSGIGAATVRMLADEGASVVVCYNKGEDRARALIAELPKGNHRSQQLAVEDSASVRRAADEIGKAYGRADILVNSAGFTRPVPHAQLDALDDALLDSILIANVRGPFSMIRALRPAAAGRRRQRDRQCLVDLGFHRLRQQYRLLRLQGLKKSGSVESSSSSSSSSKGESGDKKSEGSERSSKSSDSSESKPAGTPSKTD